MAKPLTPTEAAAVKGAAASRFPELLAKKKWPELAAAFNKPGTVMVPKKTISRAALVGLSIAADLTTMKTLPPEVAATWRDIGAKLPALADEIDARDPVAQMVFTAAVADKLHSQATIDAATKQPGSVAELVLGVGAKLNAFQIQQACS